VHPAANAIRDRESRADAATALSEHHRAIADTMILAELRTKTCKQLAAELGCTVGHIRAVVRRSKRRKAESATS
jgi:hypothetical protein